MSEPLDLSADFAAMVDPEPPEAVAVESPVDPWLVRRGFGFGASDVAVVLAALGRRSPDDLPVYMQKRVKLKRVRGMTPAPRVFMEKAGVVAPLKVGGPANLGSEREPELVRQWLDKVRRGAAGPDCLMLVAGSAHYVEGDWPRQLIPFVDPHCFRHRVSPDVLIENAFGGLECWDAKCSFKPYDGIKWCHRVQVTSQMAACNAEAGGILEGEGWSAPFRDHAGEPMGAIVSRSIERDEALVDEIRSADEEGWQRVEAIREEWRNIE